MAKKCGVSGTRFLDTWPTLAMLFIATCLFVCWCIVLHCHCIMLQHAHVKMRKVKITQPIWWLHGQRYGAPLAWLKFITLTCLASIAEHGERWGDVCIQSTWHMVLSLSEVSPECIQEASIRDAISACHELHQLTDYFTLSAFKCGHRRVCLHWLHRQVLSHRFKFPSRHGAKVSFAPCYMDVHHTLQRTILIEAEKGSFSHNWFILGFFDESEIQTWLK